MDNETEMSESFLQALGKYLQAMARHDDDMKGITTTLLNARSCGPTSFSDVVIIEAITRLSELQYKAKVGTEHHLDDDEMDVAEMEFEQVMRVNLFNTKSHKIGGNDSKKS